MNHVGHYLPVLYVSHTFKNGQSVNIQVTSKHSTLSEGPHIFLMPVFVQKMAFRWQPNTANHAGLITWIALIYANTLKC